MRRAVMLWVLALASVCFVPIALLGLLGGSRFSNLGSLFDYSLIVSPLAAVVLILWMLLSIRRDDRLTSRERRNWELLIFVGGPITALSYLLRARERSGQESG